MAPLLQLKVIYRRSPYQLSFTAKESNPMMSVPYRVVDLYNESNSYRPHGCEDIGLFRRGGHDIPANETGFHVGRDRALWVIRLYTAHCCFIRTHNF